MALMKVEDALNHLLDGISNTKVQSVPLSEASGRILAQDMAATRNQPPFDASAMDGYAVKADNLKDLPAKLKVIGEVPAGHSFAGEMKDGEAVRIFTGAPVPAGADAILIQENTERDGDFVTALEPVSNGKFIRPAGLDFKEGEVTLTKGIHLTPRQVALGASMNYAEIPVLSRPKVAILATGDELVPPGETPAADQIISSNNFGVAGQAEQVGAETLNLGIAKDQKDAIAAKIKEAQDWGADILVTIGGASVGDHDLVQDVLTEAGMDLNFWRIAMRPGKPLMAGNLGSMQVLGLPGNPVSSMVCAHIFLQPLIRAMLGQNETQPLQTAKLAMDLGENDQRQDYLRARLEKDTATGQWIAHPFSKQDSAMMARFADADCLIIRPPFAPAANKDDSCTILVL
ncbi:gephyrin-like molybdotransferase Glp [Cohaesibacter gelatinilyticus]|uniref:Molybdopterin molybdenumtransferase n=1 Tax=Cohaesibacter gelatinilyticus TaxID=372072 RepID=A0A285NJJ7_9HYPH|nr:gephyrin-like molybdotransferase Glp [Cohaesibacter gelatinilyticus]SNZ07821.1 molybdopterin molybdotransferase [Cohaesibacter gelatinilyticus]